MATVKVVIVTKDQVFPTGTTAGQYRYSLVGGSPTPIPVQNIDGLEATFNDVPAGEYTAHVIRLDSAGNPLGSEAISAPFIIGGGDVTVAVPDTVTVTVS